MSLLSEHSIAYECIALSLAICLHCKSTFNPLSPFPPNPHSCCWPPPLGPPAGPHHLHLTLTQSHYMGAGGHILWLGEVHHSSPYFVNLSLFFIVGWHFQFLSEYSHPTELNHGTQHLLFCRVKILSTHLFFGRTLIR